MRPHGTSLLANYCYSYQEVSGWGGNSSKVRKNGRAERLKGGKVHFSSDGKRIRGLADARLRPGILLYMLFRMSSNVYAPVRACGHAYFFTCLVACLLTCMRACVRAAMHTSLHA